MKTMKIMRRLMGCAAAILALSACSESEDLLSAFHSDPNAVRITAQVGKASADGFTRSNPLGTAEEQAKFNENDEISVQAEGQDAVTYKYDGKEWQPQGDKFLKWESNEMNFIAYYPATFNGNINQPTEYPNIESLAAADFMSFSGSQTNTNGNQLTLTMNRKMARVVVEIAGFNDQYTKNATVNSLSICGVKAYKHSDNKFYALIDPSSTPSTTAPFLSLEVADGESKTTEKYTTTPTTFVAGKSYTYKLTVGKNKISVSGISVTPWNTGTITDNGKAELVPFITFTPKGEQVFKMTASTGYTISGLEYSVNYGEWTPVVKDSEVSFGGDKGDLRLRGKNENGTAKFNGGNATITFTNPDVKVACKGDIRTLLDWENYKTVNTQNARFSYLFKDCAVLTSAPELPATTLANNCYYIMFGGCTSLTSAPELPATTLANNCYQYMFHGCTNLTAAPELPATTLANGCYYSMFDGCTNLTAAPELPATTLAKICYSYMFDGCKSLTSAPELPATTLANGCYENMFLNCTKLSTVTMLAPSEKISKASNCCYNWLYNAGTDKTVTSRTLKVMDADAYTALEGNGVLPAIWQKDAEGTTVLYENNGK